MPLISSIDGINRRIFLDASVIDASWKPIDVFIEYLRERRDNENLRKFEPLIKMIGGEPTGQGSRQPNLLQLLTDRRNITTKLVIPDNTSNGGFYRTRVDGTLSTDIPDIDAEPFDPSNLTHPVVIDYKPKEAEIIELSSGVILTEQDIQNIADAVWNKQICP